MDTPVNKLTEMIATDFGISQQDALDEAALVALLSHRGGDMMANEMEYLMGMLYRLDVQEAKTKAALSASNPEAAHITIAKLIIERQKQRLKTKLNSFKPLPDDMKDWAW